MRTIFAAIGLVGVVAIGCSEKNQPVGSGTPIDEGVAASKSWLAIVDAGHYDDSWEQTSEYFQRLVPKEQWRRQVAGVRGPLGPVLSRDLASAEPTTNLPGAPDGEYVVIQYQTKFQNKANAVETVTPMRGKDGLFRVSGYYVR